MRRLYLLKYMKLTLMRLSQRGVLYCSAGPY